LAGEQRDNGLLVLDDVASNPTNAATNGEIDLSKLEPLIAMPSNPDNVVPVREVAGTEVYQTYIGSSANPGYRDFAIVAEMVRGRTAHPRVSLDINPSSRQILENLIRDGYIGPLIHAGARLHQAGCNGCIGMGQAPATEVLPVNPCHALGSTSTWLGD
jgi:aconitate hydratase